MNNDWNGDSQINISFEDIFDSFKCQFENHALDYQALQGSEDVGYWVAGHIKVKDGEGLRIRKDASIKASDEPDFPSIKRRDELRQDVKGAIVEFIKAAINEKIQKMERGGVRYPDEQTGISIF